MFFATIRNYKGVDILFLNRFCINFVRLKINGYEEKICSHDGIYFDICGSDGDDASQ